MSPIRILVIEDDAFLGVLFSDVLETLGYVVCAIEATEANAIASAKRYKPDLMLVDVRLGEGSGVVAVAEILRTAKVPHVFYSGDISCVRNSQTTAIAIQEPFRVSELAKAIKLALGASVQA